MSLWQHRNFRTFWSAQGVSELGDRVTELALPLIAVTVLHGSPSQVGLLTAAVWLPNLASVFVGSWVDQQRHKRRLMIAADLFRAATLTTLPVAVWLGWLSMAQLYGVALLAGTAHVVFNTAYPSFFVRLVTREKYLEANSKLSMTRSVSFSAGPAVGGALIQALTAPIAVLVDAFSFCFSAFQVGRVHTTDIEPDLADESLLSRARAGMGFVLRHPYLRPCLACSTIVNFFTFAAAALLILFASRNLGLSAGTIGLAFGIGAIGGLVGAMTAGPLTSRLGAGRLIAMGAVVFPAATAIAVLGAGPDWVRASALAGRSS